MFHIEETPTIDEIYEICKNYNLEEYGSLDVSNGDFFRYIHEVCRDEFDSGDYDRIEDYFNPTNVHNEIIANQYNEMLLNALKSSLSEFNATGVEIDIELVDCHFNSRDCHINQKLIIDGYDIAKFEVSESVEKAYFYTARNLLCGLFGDMDFPDYDYDVHCSSYNSNVDLSSIMKKLFVNELFDNEDVYMIAQREVEMWFSDIDFAYEKNPLNNRNQLVMRLNHDGNSIRIYNEYDFNFVQQKMIKLETYSNDNMNELFSEYKKMNDHQKAYDKMLEQENKQQFEQATENKQQNKSKPKFK